MPREISVVSPRSACPACEAPIAAYDNIPVLSWIMLAGRCRKCKAPISPRYAAVELLTGVLFALAYFSAPGMVRLIRQQWPLDGAPNEFVIAAKLCVLAFLLIGLIFTDAETKLLPDLLTKPGIALGLFFSLFVPLEGPARSFLPAIDNWRVLSLVNSIAGLAGAFMTNSMSLPGHVWILVGAVLGCAERQEKMATLPVQQVAFNEDSSGCINCHKDVADPHHKDEGLACV
jgi:prepilin signal peptidase PulO-like enzyme (type II secretory pathway)